MLLGQHSLAASRVLGDFNNDGYHDLAIGVPHEAGYGFAAVGAVNVLYGSETGLQSTGVGGPEDQIWDQNTAGVQGTAEAGDEFGGALAVGDFNGDGHHDLAIGVPFENLEALNNTGAVHVLYGSGTGLQATGAGAPDDQLWHQDRPGVQDTAEAGDRFGRGLAVGDFNGDGIDDLAIAAYLEDLAGGLDDAGAVNVLYGSGTGLQASGAGGPNDQFWHQDSTGVLDTAEDDDWFGYALTVGDFNDDDVDDLVIGAPQEDLGAGGIARAGAVNALYGSDTGLQATGAGGPDDQFWNQDSVGVQDAAELADLFGHALAAGDFNGDGKDDLAIGVPTEGVGAVASAGAVNVLHGSETGLQATGVGGPDDQFWHQDSAGVRDIVESFDAFGNTLAAGDFNSDGHDDLAIAVVFENVSSLDDAGAVNILHGSTTGLQATGAGGPDDQFWHQDSAGVLGMAEEGDQFSWGLAAGDFNGDTFDDLAVGVPGEDASAGSVNVLYGSAALGLQATGVGGPNDQLWHQDSPGVRGQLEAGDAFGAFLPQGGDTF